MKLPIVRGLGVLDPLVGGWVQPDIRPAPHPYSPNPGSPRPANLRDPQVKRTQAAPEPPPVPDSPPAPSPMVPPPTPETTPAAPATTPAATTDNPPTVKNEEDLALPKSEKEGGGGEPTKEEEKEEEEAPAAEPTLLMKALGMKDSPVKVYGWIQNSYTGNANGVPKNGRTSASRPTTWPIRGRATSTT